MGCDGHVDYKSMIGHRVEITHRISRIFTQKVCSECPTLPKTAVIKKTVCLPCSCLTTSRVDQMLSSCVHVERQEKLLPRGDGNFCVFFYLNDDLLIKSMGSRTNSSSRFSQLFASFFFAPALEDKKFDFVIFLGISSWKVRVREKNLDLEDDCCYESCCFSCFKQQFVAEAGHRHIIKTRHSISNADY